MKASNLLSGISTTGPTLPKKFRISWRAAWGRARSNVKAVNPRPLRQTGLGIALAQPTSEPSRARRLVSGTPATRLTEITGRRSSPISLSKSATDSGLTATISRCAWSTALRRPEIWRFRLHETTSVTALRYVFGPSPTFRAKLDSREGLSRLSLPRPGGFC